MIKLYVAQALLHSQSNSLKSWKSLCTISTNSRRQRRNQISILSTQPWRILFTTSHLSHESTSQGRSKSPASNGMNSKTITGAWASEKLCLSWEQDWGESFCKDQGWGHWVPHSLFCAAIAEGRSTAVLMWAILSIYWVQHSKFSKLLPLDVVLWLILHDIPSMNRHFSQKKMKKRKRQKQRWRKQIVCYSSICLIMGTDHGM